MSEIKTVVTPNSVILDGELNLECGKTLTDINLIYETYGKLNQDASNAILICHALSGNHHAAGYYEGEKRLSLIHI